jgi:hypothetical protein
MPGGFKFRENGFFGNRQEPAKEPPRCLHAVPDDNLDA